MSVGPIRHRRRAWRAGALLTMALAGIAWAALAPLPAGPRELVYVIPAGTAARQARGERVSALPSMVRLTLGVQDVLIIKNEDGAEQRIGPALLGPGQTYRLPFRAPAEIPLMCSAHADGQLTIVVEAAPGPGPGRLRWRLRRLAAAIGLE
jgi:hypothetical protein